MPRSLKKGPYVDERVIKKIRDKRPQEVGVVKTWSRSCIITPDMVGFTFGIHNGRKFVEVFITEEMVGHRLGEFSPTRTFVRHGGRMQKELETAAKQKEVEASKAEKAEESKK